MKDSPFAAVNAQAAAAVIAVFLVFAVLFGNPDATPVTGQGTVEVSQQQSLG
ncbi:hypothetical protein [Tessaracoccus sp. Z1128]